MNMIEKVARAICYCNKGRWGQEGGLYNLRYLEEAKAAIEAMKEPTEEMIKAGEKNFFEHMPEARDWTLIYTKDAYQDMIEAALKDG